MGYNKVVVSGNILEIYEYDKNIRLFTRPKRKNAVRNDRPLLDTDGANLLQAREVGKRRDSARRARVAFGRLVRSNLVGAERPILLTLTYAENVQSLKLGYRDFTSFVQALRYHLGQDFKYVSVPEFQKRGALHFHALVWGLPEALVLRERSDRFLAKLWSKGFIFLTQTDGNEKLSHYLTKYMSKAYLDPRLKGCKAYVGSRNLMRPTSMAGVSPLWPILDEYKLSPDMLLRSVEYMTQWLGKGRYRRYQINPI